METNIKFFVMFFLDHKKKIILESYIPQLIFKTQLQHQMQLMLQKFVLKIYFNYKYSTKFQRITTLQSHLPNCHQNL